MASVTISRPTVWTGVIRSNESNGSMRRILTLDGCQEWKTPGRDDTADQDPLDHDELEFNSEKQPPQYAATNNSSSSRTVRVHLDAESYPAMAVWISFKKARQLLSPGVVVRCQAEVRADNSYLAHNLIIHSILLSAPYLSSLFSFSIPRIYQLFPDPNDKSPSVRLSQATTTTTTTRTTTTTPPAMTTNPPPKSLPRSFLYAVRPLDQDTCSQLIELCHEETKAGRAVRLFKHGTWEEVLTTLRAERPVRGRKHKAPPTKRSDWEALRRLKQRWSNSGSSNTSTSTRDDHHDDGHDDDDDGHGDDVPRIEASNTDLSIPSRLVFGQWDVDPVHNLPDPTDRRRLQYLNERKRPQIWWMLQRIIRLVDDDEKPESMDPQQHPQNHGTEEETCGHKRRRGPSDDLPTTPPRRYCLVDIGGGRGDLALTVAAYYATIKKEALPPHSYHVTVLDVNESSLEAGKARAKALGLEGSAISFQQCDVGNIQQLEEVFSPFRGSDVVVIIFGLHCCGGLSEAAIELALRKQARFCVSTCCFRSHPHLASLTKHAETLVVSSAGAVSLSQTLVVGDTATTIDQYRKDVDRVAMLTTGASRDGQEQAIRALNDMRIAVAMQQSCVLAIQDTSTTTKGAMLNMTQESFPRCYSVQNQVLVGRYD